MFVVVFAALLGLTLTFVAQLKQCLHCTFWLVRIVNNVVVYERIVQEKNQQKPPNDNTFGKTIVCCLFPSPVYGGWFFIGEILHALGPEPAEFLDCIDFSDLGYGIGILVPNTLVLTVELVQGAPR